MRKLQMYNQQVFPYFILQVEQQLHLFYYLIPNDIKQHQNQIK
jgi:hypothetical protein